MTITLSSSVAHIAPIRSHSANGPSVAAPAGADGDRYIVPIADLLPADSARTSGEDPEHTRTLAELDSPLPPILVHRVTMRVIDGVHRLRAAVLRGADSIEVKFFDGNELDAFVAGVRSNTAHGLPLTQAERRSAAERILRSHPGWSDRAIADVAGLAGQTVAALRLRLHDELPQALSRVGRDGRVRPLDGAEGRLRAGELIAERPDASLREIARFAGISVRTARDVRERARSGEALVPNGRGRRPAGPKPADQADPPPVADLGLVLANLRADPSLRFSDVGRGILRWLDIQVNGASGWRTLLMTIPPHSTYRIAVLARGVAAEWLAFADGLEAARENGS